jgi:hypothetical protein
MAKRKRKTKKTEYKFTRLYLLSTGGYNRQSLISLQVVLKVYKLDGSLSDKRKLFFFAVS